MNCTDDMYRAFKDAAYGPTSDNETMADSFKNGIEAAMACKAKSVVWSEAIGRVIIPGPKHDHNNMPRKSLRSYEEYSKDNLADAKGFWCEGEELFTRSQVEQMLR